jgi:hypothetical protein
MVTKTELPMPEQPVTWRVKNANQWQSERSCEDDDHLVVVIEVVLADYQQ